MPRAAARGCPWHVGWPLPVTGLGTWAGRCQWLTLARGLAAASDRPWHVGWPLPVTGPGTWAGRGQWLTLARGLPSLWAGRGQWLTPGLWTESPTSGTFRPQARRGFGRRAPASGSRDTPR